MRGKKKKEREEKDISNYTEVKLLHTLPVGTRIMDTKYYVKQNQNGRNASLWSSQYARN